MYLALVGGAEWQDGCAFDGDLLAASGAGDVLVLPTAAAYEHPDRAVETARAWFAGFGGTVRPLTCSPGATPWTRDRPPCREARFVYLSGGSPLHLRSVLKETPGLGRAGGGLGGRRGGGRLVGRGHGPLRPDGRPPGRALTVGLGLVENLAVLPHAEADVAAHHRRTLELAGDDLVVAAVAERTALLRDPDGGWRVAAPAR